MKKKTILVTGAGGSAGINFIECLRMAPEPMTIVGGDINRWHLELPEVDHAVLMPHCWDSDYVEKLCRLIERYDVDMIFAQPDMELSVISAARDRIPSRFFLPRHDVVEACHDKMETNRRLAAAGVPIPASRQVERLDDLQELIDEMLMHGDRAWLRATRGAGSRAALPVRSVRHAREWIHYWRSTGRMETSDFMISEFLPGKEFAFQSVWNEGELVTSQARERLEYVFGNLMPSGQSSSPAVACTVHDKQVNRVATEAVKAVDDKPHGVFCVDLKTNAKGVPCVTEINIGRFFTTSNFFAAAGSNMPYYALKLGFSEEIPELPKYDALEEDLYWIRLIDKGPKLVRGSEFRARPLAELIAEHA